MQGNVTSFLIDHKKLIPGVYLHEVKEIAPNVFVTTFDIRFKKPNSNDYLTPLASHSLEHIIATYFSIEHPNEKIYFGPMGCLTGFYLLLKGKVTVNELLLTFNDLNDFIHSLNDVPAKNPDSCGNYQLLSLKEAIKAWDSFYSQKDKWGTKYPILAK